MSVVVPAFNAERTLDATVNSVRRQTYRSLEIVVVDDGSRDGTADLARRHAAEDERIRLISTPNGGVANARNTGIAATKAPYVATIDSDDLWHPDKIALQMRAMAEGGRDVGYVYSLSRRIDEQDHVLGDVKSHPMQGRIYLRSIVFNPVGNGSSILARRGALEQAGGFESGLEYQGGEDNLIQIMMNRTWLAQLVPLYLTGYRQTAGSRSSDIDHAARGRFVVLRHVARQFPETPEAVLVLAEGRARAILASQAFRQNKIAQGLAELAWACRLAPFYAIEIAAVDLAGRVRGRARSAIGRFFSRDTRAGKDFFDCDPASPVGLPPRPLEKRKLEALGKTEEAFFRSVPSPQVAPKAVLPPASGSI